ncbi:MAG: AAA family ATPase [Intestinimonas sp.]
MARGHILLEDIPGVGKTTMALAFSRALGLAYHRVQFTPDVMPSDITGFSLYNKAAGRMEYQPGAVLCNLFLADELNRATSRTQSALLEAMEEGQVTVDGISHPVPQPFLVIATQNPTGASGTQLLPDSQLDRFTLRLSIRYPRPEDELELLRRRRSSCTLDGVRQVVDREGLERMRAQVDQVHIADEILDYMVRLSAATRSHPLIVQGASPRATLAVAAVSRAAAFVRGRDYVIPEDVADIFRDTVAHRLILHAGVRWNAAGPPGRGAAPWSIPQAPVAAVARRRRAYALLLAAALLFHLFDIGYLACFLLALALTLPVLGMLLSLPAMLRCRLELQAEPTGVERGGEAGWRLAAHGPVRLPLAQVTIRLRMENALTGGKETRRVTPHRPGRGAKRCPAGGRLPLRPTDMPGGEGQEYVTVWDCSRCPSALPRRPPCWSCLRRGRLCRRTFRGREQPERRAGAPARRRSGEDYDLRPYRPGDPIRTVHWKLTSKRDELVVRETLEPRRSKRSSPLTTLAARRKWTGCWTGSTPVPWRCWRGRGPLGPLGPSGERTGAGLSGLGPEESFGVPRRRSGRPAPVEGRTLPPTRPETGMHRLHLEPGRRECHEQTQAAHRRAACSGPHFPAGRRPSPVPGPGRYGALLDHGLWPGRTVGHTPGRMSAVGAPLPGGLVCAPAQRCCRRWSWASAGCWRCGGCGMISGWDGAQRPHRRWNRWAEEYGFWTASWLWARRQRAGYPEGRKRSGPSPCGCSAPRPLWALLLGWAVVRRRRCWPVGLLTLLF